jgi:hypothetical protein
MTIMTVGYVTFNTHQVHISKDDLSDRIYCFKSTNTRCDYAVFDSAYDLPPILDTFMPKPQVLSATLLNYTS